MAETGGFDREFGRIDGILGGMREVSQIALKRIAETADQSALPEEEWLKTEEARLAAEIPERRAAEASLARLTLELATAISLRKTEFDNRKQPTRGEKLVGYLSKSAMRRRIEMRSASPAVLTHLEKLLGRCDALAGLLEGERNALLKERKEGESGLGTLIDHRPEMTAALRGEGGAAMTGVEATARMENAVSLFNRFVGELNLRVAACNVMRQKLVTDVEDLLILYQAVFDVSRRNDSVSFEAERFPHLAPEIGRFAQGMLTVRALATRRERADHAFMEFFPALAAGDAQPSQQGDRRPAKAAGFRLLRS